MTPPYEDLTALRRDADTLDRLSAGADMSTDGEREALVDVLVALRDEAREPVPEIFPAAATVPTAQRSRSGGAHAAARSRRGHKRMAAGAAVALVSMSLTGVAAAVGGDSFLAPIRAMIAQVTHSGDADTEPEEAPPVPDHVAQLLHQSRQAFAIGDHSLGAQLLGQAREAVDSLEGPAADEAAAEVTSVEEEMTGTVDTDAGSTAEATGPDAELGSTTSAVGTSDGGSPGGVELGGSGGNGGSGWNAGTSWSGGSSGSGGSFDPAGPGQSIVPSRAQPRGLGMVRDRDGAPGRPGRPGAWIDPPRPQSTASAVTSDAADDGPDEDESEGGLGGQGTASAPGASGAGSAGRHSRGPSSGAVHSGDGSPEPRPGGERDAHRGTEDDRPGTREDHG